MSKSNDIVKPAKPNAKPRSKLQQITSQANWAVHFRLQPFNNYQLNALVLTPEYDYVLAEAVNTYNQATDKLKVVIKACAAQSKATVRARDRKLLAYFDKASKQALIEADRLFLPF